LPMGNFNLRLLILKHFVRPVHRDLRPARVAQSPLCLTPGPAPLM
jgi:hypothetical protein